eukprot:symbB.v1.2.023058.t1/scaffold2037.1/size91541/1
MAAVDILINNAGLALGVSSAIENELGNIQTMLATNVTAVMCLVATFGPQMRQRGKGHIVNISSVAGHECYVGGSAYCATKHAVNAFTIASRHDLAGTPIRVTAISPGMVETEFSKVRFGDNAKAAKVYENIVPLVAEDIADQIIYVTTRPRHVQIADIISYATNQGHAKYVIERQGESMGAPGITLSGLWLLGFLSSTATTTTTRRWDPGLALCEDELPGASLGNCGTSPYVSWSTSLGPSASQIHSPGRCFAVQSLLELEPMLGRHLLGKESRASPLHPCVRQITEECCEKQFSKPLAELLQSATGLRQRLQRLISAESRDEEDKLPPIEVPNCWSHPRLTCRRLLLRDSNSLSGFDLCASGWSGLCSGAIYSDLSRLLTDVLFEAVKLPSFIEDMHMIYATAGHAGVAVPPVLLGEDLGITTGAAALILERAQQQWTEEALGELFREATQDERPFAVADLAYGTQHDVNAGYFFKNILYLCNILQCDLHGRSFLLPLQDVRSHAQNSIPVAKVSAPALSVLAFAASVMASPCFVAPQSPLSSPGQATSLHVKAEAAFKAETASTRWTSSGLVLPATLLAAGIGRRRQCRRHARSAKVVRQVIGPAVAAAAAAAKVAAAGKLAAAGGGAAAVAAGIKTLSKKRPTEHRSGERKKMVILGTGWGSVTFLQGLSEDIAKFYDITVVSPRNFFLYTPLLPASTMGSIEERSIVTPIRRVLKGKADFLEAKCEHVDVKNKVLRCTRAGTPDNSADVDYDHFPEEDSPNKKTFDVDYDVLVYGIGAQTNDFKTPGVQEHAFFFKELTDARKVRDKVTDLFERASLPGVSEHQKERWLSFVVVGGGPTGVEVAADLADFLAGDAEEA